ncbi:DNA polymerase III subunit gamma and tau [Schaalia sp. 19OD2882]|uniref:DNA polymerase III subunit gamma and tau n=1 Tax=Schaalia sp. 19OD2882 TaxID=2794089 RepID=UPI001C1EAD03|nr:DNA polymerase III subunit gamma and tau [Schaalia sp. 19OD2882]QWW19736.1 DNA polymerase III subunit gamma and tau [Schaalia sp. 19OD2882]
MSTALYRRYRPDSFAQVIGQDHVTAPLRAALRANRVTHAYLFSGPRGCGKTTSARILARCLNCAQGPTDTPCGHCDSCRELATGGPGSLDVVEIDAASHGGVDDARDLRERATFAPVRDRYKVFIIDEAHMVTAAGFNALLKLVEEPPEHVKFVFATTEPEKVIGTIRSRTHHYPFRLVPPDVLGPYLSHLCDEEHIRVDQGVVPMVMRAGGGSVRDSLSVLDQLMAGSIDGVVAYDTAVALLGYTDSALLDQSVDALAGGDGAAAYRVVERMVESGHDPRRFVEDLLRRLRDLLIIAVAGDGAAEVLAGTPSDQVERMFVQARNWGPRQLSRAADLTDEALRGMTGATSPRLQLELLLGRILVPAQNWAAGADPSAKDGPGGQSAPMPRTAGMVRGGAPLEDEAGHHVGPGVSGEGGRFGAAQAREELARARRAREASRAGAPGTGSAAEPRTQPQGRPFAAATPEESAQTPGQWASEATPGWEVREPGSQAAAGARAPSEESGGDEAVAPVGEADTSRSAPAATAAEGIPPVDDQRAPQAAVLVDEPAVAHADAVQDPAPAPAPRGGIGHDADVLRGRWEEVVERLAGLSRAAWSMVRQHGQLGAVDAEVAVLVLPTAGHVDHFTNAGRGEVLATAIYEVTGLRRSVVAQVGQAGGGRPVTTASAPVNDPPPSGAASGQQPVPAAQARREARGRSPRGGEAGGSRARADRDPAPAHSRAPRAPEMAQAVEAAHGHSAGSAHWPEPAPVPQSPATAPSQTHAATDSADSRVADSGPAPSSPPRADAARTPAELYATYLPGDPDAQWHPFDGAPVHARAAGGHSPSHEAQGHGDVLPACDEREDLRVDSAVPVDDPPTPEDPFADVVPADEAPVGEDDPFDVGDPYAAPADDDPFGEADWDGLDRSRGGDSFAAPTRVAGPAPDAGGSAPGPDGWAEAVAQPGGQAEVSFDDSPDADPFATPAGQGREDTPHSRGRGAAMRAMGRSTGPASQGRPARAGEHGTAGQHSPMADNRPSAAEDDSASLDDQDVDVTMTSGVPAVLEILGGKVIDTTYDQGV